MTIFLRERGGETNSTISECEKGGKKKINTPAIQRPANEEKRKGGRSKVSTRGKKKEKGRRDYAGWDSSLFIFDREGKKGKGESYVLRAGKRRGGGHLVHEGGVNS